ncbi:MAG: DUF507 family protein [Deltaproteobacteria bacterium]|nr:DUF507 family protein [Deltaproteobacteria bacterium]
MKIKQDQVEKVCQFLVQALQEKKLIKFKASEREVFETLVKAFIANLAEEEEIDLKAKEVLEQTMENTPENIDRQKMFLMIKRKLAKERGFIL